jgi:manganese transport protein
VTIKERLKDSLAEVNDSVKTYTTGSWLKRFLAFSGPAYLVSVGYMDPGNWATDIAGGSRFGYQLLWVLLMSNGMALLLQSLAARLGVVTGLDLAQASKKYFPKTINIALYLLAQFAIIACDLAEVLGFAIGVHLLFGLDLIWGVAISLLDTFLILALQRFGMKKLEAFIIALVGIIGVSFLIELLIAKPSLPEVSKGFLPTVLTKDSLLIAIGILGATVMPHNLYLHSSLVQTRQFKQDEKSLRQVIRFNFFDSAIALNLAFFVNAAILILAAAAFHFSGHTEVASIENAHHLLDAILGSKLAPILFAVALIASGQSSTITGTLAGQIIMEGYLNLKMKPWIRRLLTRSLAIIPAIATLLFFGEEKLDVLLILSQVILSLQLGFAIIPLIHFVSKKKWMGAFTLSRFWVAISWIVAIIIIGLNINLVIEQFQSALSSNNNSMVLITKWIGIPIAFLAIVLLLYTVFAPWLLSKKEKAQVE